MPTVRRLRQHLREQASASRKDKRQRQVSVTYVCLGAGRAEAVVSRWKMENKRRDDFGFNKFRVHRSAAEGGFTPYLLFKYLIHIFVHT